MYTAANDAIKPNNQEVQNVAKFRYLGQIITTDFNATTAVNDRMTIGRPTHL